MIIFRQSLGMMINLVEHCELNRRLLVSTETVCYYEAAHKSTINASPIEAIEALTQVS